jgi:hypothetical protein
MDADSDRQDQCVQKNPVNWEHFQDHKLQILLTANVKVIKKFKYEKVVKKKNKPFPALVSFQLNQQRTLKSREIISLFTNAIDTLCWMKV